MDLTTDSPSRGVQLDLKQFPRDDNDLAGPRSNGCIEGLDPNRCRRLKLPDREVFEEIKAIGVEGYRGLTLREASQNKEYDS